MEIKIDKFDKHQLNQKQVFSWPIWEKEVSSFDWHYDTTEECFLLEGEVTVKTKDGHSVTFQKGDFVTFPQGLSCHWEITKAVRKHYNFS